LSFAWVLDGEMSTDKIQLDRDDGAVPNERRLQIASSLNRRLRGHSWRRPQEGRLLKRKLLGPRRIEMQSHPQRRKNNDQVMCDFRHIFPPKLNY
jgi:hypothetical protein